MFIYGAKFRLCTHVCLTTNNNNVYIDVITDKDVNEHDAQVHVAAAGKSDILFCHGTRFV